MTPTLSALILASQLATAPGAVNIPIEVQKDIDYAAEMCGALGERFKFSMEYLQQVDLNMDQKPDYIIDTRGYDCGRQTASLFRSAAGQPLYLYLSDEEGWKKVFNAYAYEYRVKKVYGEPPQFDVWVRGEVGYQVNFVRHQWNGEELEVIEQEMGVEVPKQMWKNFD